jgi:hypothetical protein
VTSNLPPETHTSYEACTAAEHVVAARRRALQRHVRRGPVGRIDHSEGDKVELGESKRMNNPCPPPPTPTPVPAPAPPTKIVAGIDHNWTAFRTWTRNERLLVTDIPDGAAVELRCSGKGKVRRFTIRRSKTPATQLLCLPPGRPAPRAARTRIRRSRARLCLM